MQTPLSSIGQHLRQVFASIIGRPLGWSQIDALASLEEREEAIQSGKVEGASARPIRGGDADADSEAAPVGERPDPRATFEEFTAGPVWRSLPLKIKLMVVHLWRAERDVP
jgi:hypothetical protein